MAAQFRKYRMDTIGHMNRTTDGQSEIPIYPPRGGEGGRGGTMNEYDTPDERSPQKS